MEASMRSTCFFLTLVLAAGCRDLTLPEQPVLGPGTLRATVLATKPGRPSLRPAVGARMHLLGSTLEAVADDDGNVALSGLMVSTGQVLVEFDGDGSPDSKRARLLSLEALRAGFGKDVSLGQLVLGNTGTVVGIVRRADVSTTTGHGGISVFAPQLRPLTFTGDDGAFVLEGLPEGELTIAASAPEYDSTAVNVSLGSGAEQRLSSLSLRRTPPGATTATLTGQVRSRDGAPLDQVTVRALRGAGEVSTLTGADGTFTFTGQPIGFTLLALEKAGFAPLAVGNVVVEAPLTTIGPFFLSEGSGNAGPLVLPSPPDGGTTGGGGGATGGGGGATGGGGGATGGGGGATGGGGGATGGGGGSLDAGPDAGADAGIDAGLDAGVDAGVGPVAIVGAPQVAAPGSVVTLDGTASTGRQPLTYTWTALAPNASVVVTPNGSVGGHSATFTAGAVGNVLEFSLVVTDRFGISSTNTAIARVVVSRIPVARFGPDSGTYFGGDSIELVSTSFDDGGLLLTGYSWAQVPPVAGATLVADGGRAVLTFPPLMPGNAAALVGVELTVSNVLGVASAAPARQTYVARPNDDGGSNWALTATLQGPSPILFNGSNPVSRLVPVVTTTLSSPSYSLNWQCANLLTTSLVTDGGVFEFAVPRIVGPDVIASCQVTATGAPPLNPPTLTSTISFALRDDEDPAVATVRTSPWGLLLRTTEPTNVSAATCSAIPAEREGNALIAFSLTLINPAFNPQVCPAWSGTLFDFATPPNAIANVTLAPAYSTAPQWEGPFVTSASYDDPRPVLVSAGVLPFDTLAASNPPMNPPTPYALVARDGTNLLQLSLDVLSPPQPCTPDCVLPVTPTPLIGLPAANGAPQGVRATSSGTYLLVAMHEGTGGTVYARRSPAGAWSTVAFEGELFNAARQLRRVVVTDGGVVSDVFDPATGSFSAAELITVLPPDGGTASGGETRFTSRTALVTVNRNGSFAMFQRDPLSATWDAGSSGAASTTGVIGYRPSEDTNVGSLATLAVRSIAPHVQVYERPGGVRGVNSLGTPTGFDLIQRGQAAVVAVTQNGDLRLYADSLTTTVMAPVEGPPRAVPLAPGDNRFDLDVSCEAAYPRLGFIENALVVTWQERCAPSTTWRIAARVIR
jgi:hypothetical protein